MTANLLFLAALATADSVHRYDVHVDAALTRLEVRACFADGLPDRLIADHPLATDATVEFRYLRDGRTVTARPRSNAILLPMPSDDGCMAWRSDLNVIAGAERMNVGYRTRDALLFAPGTWFWRPSVLTRNRELEITFHLPANMRISAPWPVIDTPALDEPVRVPYADNRANTWRFRHGHTPLDWPALMAIGDLETVQFEVAGTPFRLAVAPGPARVDANAVRGWLQPAAQAVTELWGEFPSAQVQLLVVPLNRGYDAAPWAQVNRGGGDAVHFFMNAHATPEMLREDWIATHELAHLALPFVHRQDAWLPEGFASYYQNVLRARAGLLTEEQAWQAMYEGFLAGNRNTGYETLRDDARYMRSRGRMQRVYWSGAAMALLADVELRRRSDGEWSLDRVLQEFNRCCRKPERAWSGREVFAAFDEIVGDDVFEQLYRRNVHSRHFPRLAETWQALGVEVRDDRVFLNDAAPAAFVRRAIMQPRTR